MPVEKSAVRQNLTLEPRQAGIRLRPGLLDRHRENRATRGFGVSAFSWSRRPETPLRGSPKPRVATALTWASAASQNSKSRPAGRPAFSHN